MTGDLGAGMSHRAAVGARARARADQLIDLGRTDEALVVLAPVLAHDPEDAEAHTLAARAHLQVGTGSAARQHAETVVRLRPQAAYSHVLLSLALTHSGSQDAAAREAGEALRLDPHGQHGHVALAVAGLNRTQDIARTRSAAAAAVERAPDDPDVHVLLAQAHMYNGRTSVRSRDRRAARHHLDNALSLDPQHAEAQREVATLRAMGWSPFASLEGHARILRHDPRDTESHDGIGYALGRLPFIGHPVSWALWFVMDKALSWNGGEPNSLMWVVGALAAGVVVAVVVRLRRGLGAAMLPALRSWAAMDRLGAAWLSLLVVLNVVTVLAAIAPTGVGGALHPSGLLVLIVAVVLSWIRARRST
ncbi:MAG: tetratricopeptide repeat protein [Dermatophilaceae bacterium]